MTSVQNYVHSYLSEDGKLVLPIVGTLSACNVIYIKKDKYSNISIL